MANMKELPIRLAIRSEGNMVNAYIADANTMDDAQLIGAISRRVCGLDPAVFDAWKALMTRVLNDAIKDVFGREAEMIERPAPEHERAGHA